MSFFVEPGALDRAASLINDASNDAQTAKAYMLRHTDMQFDSQGLLNKAWQAHGHLVDEMTKRLTHLVDLLNKSRDALQGTANYYRHTDTGNAARLDATYPTVDRIRYGCGFVAPIRATTPQGDEPRLLDGLAKPSAGRACPPALAGRGRREPTASAWRSPNSCVRSRSGRNTRIRRRTLPHLQQVRCGPTFLGVLERIGPIAPRPLARLLGRVGFAPSARSL